MNNFETIFDSGLVSRRSILASTAATLVAQTSWIFDPTETEEADRDLGSPFFGVKPARNAGAFVYTDMQVSVPFKNAPWRERNPVLKQQSGLLFKTWLSGLPTQTLGGIDVFDNVQHAREFALNDFPKTATRTKGAFCTRVFDARIGENASRQMSSPVFIQLVREHNNAESMHEVHHVPRR